MEIKEIGEIKDLIGNFLVDGSSFKEICTKNDGVLAFSNKFTIQNHEDVYFAFGHLLEKVQLWEKEFELLLEKEKLANDNSSLSFLNESLFNNKRITKKDYVNIKSIIEIRNIVCYRFFLEDWKVIDIESLNKLLNTYYFLLDESVEYTKGLKNKNKKRKTIFDK